MDTLSTAEIQPLLQLAQATGLYTPAQFELIRERCVGFVNGQRADDYEVLVSRKDEVLSGFLIFRKRSLTRAAFEIGQIGSTDPGQIARLLEALRQEVLHRSGKLIFAELPDLPQWQPIHTTLQDTSYFVAGETPHVYAPGSGTRHYVLHLDRVTPEQTRMPVAVIHQPATPPAQPSTLTTVSVVPTVEAHRPAILEITATTSVF